MNPPAEPLHFEPLPAYGTWRLLGAHDGFEITHFTTQPASITLTGTSLGVEAGVPWELHYTLTLDADWGARRASITTGAGQRLALETDGAGHWRVDGEYRPDLDGCRDVDLEGSVVTNAAPIHRLPLLLGQMVEAPAVYVRTAGLRVERLEQTYQRLPAAPGLLLFDYAASRFGYHAVLRFAPDGLIIDYPGLGARVQHP